MLNELKVSNFAIIDSINVHFKPGFNVLSGETGSGKSVLLKSLALLMGEKSAPDTIKAGATQATVEGSFDLSEREDIRRHLEKIGIDPHDNTLIVKRILAHDGKNRVYINGSLSTLQQLRDIVSPLIELTGHPAPLIEMTGQHENRNLQSKAFHLEALDQYIGALDQRREVEQLFHQLLQLREELRELKDAAKNKTQRLDFLTYQREEIQTLGLKAGEEDELEQNVRRLKDSSKLREFIEAAEGAIYSDDDSALVRIHRVLQRGLEFAQHDPKIQGYLETLKQAQTLLEETMYGLREYEKHLNLNPEDLEQMQDKISQLRKLQKKYGPTVADILRALDEMTVEIETLTHADTVIEQREQQLIELQQQLTKRARALHKMRMGGAETLTKSVNAELEDLNMKGVLFSVRVTELDDVTATGLSDVEFMIQSSKQDHARSLAKFASGGELSRILLSLKRVVGASRFPRTYLFDEVDAGVSGLTAEKVGRKLKAIAKGQQVISVTHLPQVAAFAHSHFVISKSNVGGRVCMKVEELDKTEQVQEIARMLSGEKITKTSIEHAKELLRN